MDWTAVIYFLSRGLKLSARANANEKNTVLEASKTSFYGNINIFQIVPILPVFYASKKMDPRSSQTVPLAALRTPLSTPRKFIRHPELDRDQRIQIYTLS